MYECATELFNVSNATELAAALSVRSLAPNAVTDRTSGSVLSHALMLFLVLVLVRLYTCTEAKLSAYREAAESEEASGFVHMV